LERLCFSESFESILAKRFGAMKRFGIEGNESMIPGLKVLVDRVTELGVEEVVIGMPHRGRLNVLSNVVRKPMEIIFKEFKGVHMEDAGADAGMDDWSTRYRNCVSFHTRLALGWLIIASARLVSLSYLPYSSRLTHLRSLYFKF